MRRQTIMTWANSSTALVHRQTHVLGGYRMKVILKQDVKGLGKKGAVVNVAEGYGRNYLLPRGLAVEAVGGAARALEEEKKAERQKEERAIREAQALRDRLQGQTIKVPVRVGEGGRLFGSVTNKDIAEALSKLLGSEFDRKRVELKEPIKSLGTYTVLLRLGHDVTAQVQIEIVSSS